MKVVFMGAPEFATPTLETLAALEADIRAVYTKAPKPAGRRGLELTKTPVHLAAEARGLPVITPKTLRTPEAQREFESWNADLAIVAAYGLILPPAILAAPRHGCLNLHASLLPRWRGAAPIQRAIMAGDSETGVGLMRMEEGLDTGPVAREARTPISPDDTAGELAQRLSVLAAELLAQAWQDIVSGALVFHPQPEQGVEYARKVEKHETPIDWTQEAASVRNHIHGLSPSPGAHSEIEDEGGAERFKFLRVETIQGHGAPGEILDDAMTIACGEGAIRALSVQRAGKLPMSGTALMRSRKPAVGDRFKPG
jgi:methionyl-tRNA formyltransferase